MGSRAGGEERRRVEGLEEKLSRGKEGGLEDDHDEEEERAWAEEEGRGDRWDRIDEAGKVKLE